MAEHPEGSRGVAKGSSYLRGGSFFEEIGPERLVHSMPWVHGFEEEVPALRYTLWFSDGHKCRLQHPLAIVKPLERKFLVTPKMCLRINGL
jgi:hypothetical protein